LSGRQAEKPEWGTHWSEHPPPSCQGRLRRAEDEVRSTRGAPLASAAGTWLSRVTRPGPGLAGSRRLEVRWPIVSW
jgi:hypothetical protein